MGLLAGRRRRAGDADRRAGRLHRRRLAHGQFGNRTGVGIADLVNEGRGLVAEGGGLVERVDPVARPREQFRVRREDEDLVGAREGEDGDRPDDARLAADDIAFGGQHLLERRRQRFGGPEDGFDADDLRARKARLVDLTQGPHEGGDVAAASREDEAVGVQIRRDPHAGELGVEICEQALEGADLDRLHREELHDAAKVRIGLATADDFRAGRSARFTDSDESAVRIDLDAILLQGALGQAEKVPLADRAAGAARDDLAARSHVRTHRIGHFQKGSEDGCDELGHGLGRQGGIDQTVRDQGVDLRIRDGRTRRGGRSLPAAAEIWSMDLNSIHSRRCFIHDFKNSTSLWKEVRSAKLFALGQL